MTTIAYDTKTLVSDSRSCMGNTIYENDCKKIFTEVGPFAVIGIAGNYQDAMDIIKFITEYNSMDQIRTINYDITGWDAGIIGITYQGEVWHYAGEEGFELRPDLPFAIGSGSQYALAAMDLGKTAEEAVVYASTRDVYTNNVTQVASLITEEELNDTDCSKEERSKPEV